LGGVKCILYTGIQTNCLVLLDLGGVNMSEKAQNNLWLYTSLGGENETESRSIVVRS